MSGEYIDFSGIEYSTEITTISIELLTDRTLSLRKEIPDSILTSKCEGRLKKYNATRKEVVCVCYSLCRWRPPTEFEKVMNAELTRQNIRDTKIRSITLGTIYTVTFILGITGLIPRFEYSLHTSSNILIWQYYTLFYFYFSLYFRNNT